MARAKAAACPQGHAYTKENTYLHRGKQSCRTCRTAAVQRHRAANRDALNERNSEWRAANPGYDAEWRAANRERINEQQRGRRAADPDAARAASRARWDREWAAQIKNKYGITAEQYDILLARQGGGCALCGRTGNVGGKRLAVDHCHETGVVRGLLCNPCNTMLGNARDNVDLLMAAAAYILTHRNVLEVC